MKFIIRMEDPERIFTGFEQIPPFQYPERDTVSLYRPEKPLYLKGAELLGIFPVSTLPPLTALNVTAVSYVDRLNFGLIAARTAIPDLSLLTSYLDDAFGELAEAAAISMDS